MNVLFFIKNQFVRNRPEVAEKLRNFQGYHNFPRETFVYL